MEDSPIKNRHPSTLVYKVNGIATFVEAWEKEHADKALKELLLDEDEFVFSCRQALTTKRDRVSNRHVSPLIPFALRLDINGKPYDP